MGNDHLFGGDLICPELFHREHAPGDLKRGGRSSRQFFDGTAFQSGGHDHKTQILTVSPAAFKEEGKKQIALRLSFVELVKNHHRRIFKGGVVLHLAEQHAGGHGDNTGVSTGTMFVFDGVPHTLPHLFPEHGTDAQSGGRSGDTAGFHHDDLPLRELFSQSPGNTGGLARTGRCTQKQYPLFTDTAAYLTEKGFNGQCHAPELSVRHPSP